jgi:hypothetical protein
MRSEVQEKKPMRQVLLQDGRLAWVNDDGQFVRLSNGMGGAEPGFGETPQSNLPPANIYHPDARTRDLMSRLPAADIAGLRGPGVHPGGEKPSGLTRLEGHPDIPSVPTSRPLAGAQQNNRGGTRVVTVDTLNGVLDGPLTIPSIVETPRNGGDDAETIGIHLGIDFPAPLKDPTDPASAIFFQVVATIEWGTGGAIFSADVDWSAGISFSVNASWVRVSARIPFVGIFGLPPIDITLKAALSYGKSVNVCVSSPLRLVVPVGFISLLDLPTTTGFIPIPTWAVGCTLVDPSSDGLGAAPDFTIFYYDSTNTLSAVYEVTDRSNLANQVEGQFPVPSGTRYLKIRNNISSFVWNAKLIFNLAF